MNPPTTLEELIRRLGEGWVVDLFASPSAAMPEIRKLLQRTNAAIEQRFGTTASPINDAAIINEYKRSPHKIHAFIQALGQTESPEILIMVWHILQGMEIQQLRMEYRIKEGFELEITLVSPDDQHTETYRSEDIDDAALLRHLGIMKMDQKPIFDGFYAVR